MKTSSFAQRNIWQGILSILLGLVVIVWHQNIIKYFMMIAGVIFLFLGIIVMSMYYSKRKNNSELQFPISSIVYLVLGILFVIIPQSLANIVVVAMGVLLILAAIGQAYSLIKLSRNGFTVSYMRYIIPVLILVAGIVITLNPEKITGAIMIVFGIALLLYGAEELYNYYWLNQYNKKKQENGESKTGHAQQQ